MSQNTQIIQYLEQGNSLDPLTALRKFSCFRLAARIKDLRDSGYSILTTKKVIHNKMGEEIIVADYRLGGANAR